MKKGGIFIALKGPELENEIAESSNALKELGGKVVDVQQFTLADGAYTRNLAVIEKVKDTPKNIRAKRVHRKKTIIMRELLQERCI